LIRYIFTAFVCLSAISVMAKPNIVIILTDDMGFSDLGCFGSEIKTPHLDGLAEKGLRFTQFYNAGRCCPTRASLLTGLYAHQAGMGKMTEDKGPERPGYRGHLMDRCVTIAEVLKPSGYRTIQSGKWHVGHDKKECWANVSNAPFRKYKKFAHEGGIATPLIAHWPQGISAKLNGTLVKEPAHVIDLMATCVEVAGADYPEKFKGKAILPMEGKSLNSLFQGRLLKREEPLCFEHMGNRGIRQGQWKLVAQKGAAWELYDMYSDRSELHDLSVEMPERVKNLAAKYNGWAKRCFVK
jgi:arylsulfatase A-like enzyme